MSGALMSSLSYRSDPDSAHVEFGRGSTDAVGSCRIWRMIADAEEAYWDHNPLNGKNGVRRAAGTLPFRVGGRR